MRATSATGMPLTSSKQIEPCTQEPMRYTSGPNRSHVRRRPRKLSHVDPRAIVDHAVRRHLILLEPASTVALDHANLVLAGLIEEAVVVTGHAYSKAKGRSFVHIS